MDEFVFMKDVSDESFLISIDTKIFSRQDVLRTAYAFLDRGYFFFKQDASGNILVRCLSKGLPDITSEQIVKDFSDELLNVHLRMNIDNRALGLRDLIADAAIFSSYDPTHYIESKPQRDLDAEIDSILQDLENDPDLSMDEKEIRSMLSGVKRNEAGND